jgi:predicted O-methyltransferase YrrM
MTRWFSPVTFLLKPMIRHDHELKRRRVEAALPATNLRAEHVARCRVVLDRQALLASLPPGGVAAEIGVDQGDFTEQILQLAKPRRLHLIDSWATTRYNEDKAQRVQARFAARIAAGEVSIHRGLSLQAVSAFEDSTFDWIYIDSSHAYDVTAAELRAYASKMKPGGFMLGHDYSMGNWVKGFRYGVIEAVHEFCVEHDWELRWLTVQRLERPSFAISRRGA